MCIFFLGRIDRIFHGDTTPGRSPGFSDQRQSNMARRQDTQEGRGYAQLRQQQPPRDTLHNLRCGIPQARTYTRGERW